MMNEILSKKREIVVIKLDIDENKSYNKLKAVQKIKLLDKRIREVCELLESHKPAATWIICWREYGIRDINNKSISNKTKNILKKTMLNLSRISPNLIIIAGSVLTRKIKQSSYLKNLTQFYNKLRWMHHAEKRNNHSQVKKHKNKIITIRSKVKEGLDTITVTANKARVYYQGIEKKHGKTAPFNENEGIPNAIYQPGKGRNLNPVFNITEPPLNVSLGIDICREHIGMFRQLKHTVSVNKEIQKPMLHFVISSSVNLNLSSICAKYAAIHIDSDKPACVMLTRSHRNENIMVNLYVYDVTQKITELNTPIIPEYPIQYQLLDGIEAMIMQPTCSEKRAKILRSFRNEFIDNYMDINTVSRLEIESAISANKKLSNTLKIQLKSLIGETEQKALFKNFVKNNHFLHLFPEHQYISNEKENFFNKKVM